MKEEQKVEYILIAVARCDTPITGIGAELLSTLSDEQMQQIAQSMTHRPLRHDFWEDLVLSVSLVLFERKTP